MKWMKWIGVLAVLVAMGLGAAGCGGSDDDGGGGIAGTWVAQSFNGMVMPAGSGMTMVLNDNGTYIVNATTGGSTQSESGTWSATDTVLTTVGGGSADSVTYTVSGNTLTIVEPDGIWVFTR
jgi:Lipocalin-like domain